MLKENLLKNEKVKPNSREIELLKQNFPQFFSKEGEFLLEKFKEMLKMEDVKIDKEGYELKFLGKNYARFLTSTETENVIVPNIKHNEEEINKNSENLYIIGDNLDALKHLLNSYSGKIKCIYIDPPYNTGNVFVYNYNTFNWFFLYYFFQGLFFIKNRVIIIIVKILANLIYLWNR